MSKSKKSKQHRKAKLLKRRKKYRQKHVSDDQLLENFRNKMIHDPIMSGMIVDALPEGEVKMSDVLSEFVQPYLKHTSGYEDMQKLFMLAITAWNMSFLPEAERTEEIEKAATELNAPEEIRPVLRTMITRKQRHFRHYTRRILNFQLVNRGMATITSRLCQPRPGKTWTNKPLNRE